MNDYGHDAIRIHWQRRTVVLAYVIDQGLQLLPSDGEQASPCSSVLRIWSWVDMPQVCRFAGHARAGHLREFYRQANSGERTDVADDRKH